MNSASLSALFQDVFFGLISDHFLTFSHPFGFLRVVDFKAVKFELTFNIH